MTRNFVFTNHKGGVAKTTSATNIAFGIVGVLRQAGASNCRVLLVDTDSQAHATLVTTDRTDYGADNSLYTVLMADRQNAAAALAHCIVAEPMGQRSSRASRIADARRRRTRADGRRGSAVSPG